MKIKLDFITNSSSANFTIPLIHLSEKQVLMIHSHIEIGLALMRDEDRSWMPREHDGWRITQSVDKIRGDTSMDNFDMRWFLDKIGVKEDHIEYHHSNDYGFGFDDDEE